MTSTLGITLAVGVPVGREAQRGFCQQVGDVTIDRQELFPRN